MNLKYEVEQKFPVDDLAGVEARLSALGAALSGPREEVDLYFAHPARDFAVTDEALRIRRIGESNCVTYKGPKIDRTTKTRREIELALPPGVEVPDAWQELLEAIGFTPVAEIRKERRKATVPWQGREVTATLDDVHQVGTFVEIELTASQDDLEAAKACIASLAEGLGLTGSERRSYLELWLAGQG